MTASFWVAWEAVYWHAIENLVASLNHMEEDFDLDFLLLVRLAVRVKRVERLGAVVLLPKEEQHVLVW